MVFVLDSSNLVAPRQEPHHRTELPDRSHQDVCNPQLHETLSKTLNLPPTSLDLPKRNPTSKTELLTQDSRTKIPSIPTSLVDPAGTKVKPHSAINGFDSHRLVESPPRATSSKAPQAKALKDKDMPTGNRSHVLFKQTNKTNMSNFMKLRNVFSGNRS